MERFFHIAGKNVRHLELRTEKLVQIGVKLTVEDNYVVQMSGVTVGRVERNRGKEEIHLSLVGDAALLQYVPVQETGSLAKHRIGVPE